MPDIKPLSKAQIKRLKSLMNIIEKYGQRVYDAQQEISRIAEGHYGYAPSDVDSDWIIDQVFGGCGAPTGMDIEEFDKVLRKDIEYKHPDDK